MRYYSLISSMNKAVAPSILLDVYGGAKVAYSFIQLSTTETLSCRVRRSSDNAEQDFGFVGGELDTASLLSFVGANNGFVVKMYDQSGNANHAIQSTAGLQRYIVQSGVLVVYGVNGKVTSLRQNLSSGLNMTTAFSPTNEHTTFAVFDHIGTTESIGVTGSTSPYPLKMATDESVTFNIVSFLNFGITTTGEKILASYRKATNSVAFRHLKLTLTKINHN